MGLILDNRTLTVLQVVVAAVLWVVMAVAWSSQRTYPGFGRWMSSKIPHALGILLVSLNKVIPEWASVLLSDALFLIAPVLLYEGIRQFRGKKAYDPILYVIYVIVMGSIVYFWSVQPNPGLRLTLVYLFTVYVITRCAIDLFLEIEKNNAWGLRFTGTIFGLYAVVLFLRFIAAQNLPDLFNPDTANNLQNILVLITICLSIGWSFGFIMITNDRLTLELLLNEQKLRELSLTDELTGLNNRRGFRLLAEQLINTAERLNQSVALIFIDMDGMKWINDNLGHVQGDHAIIDASNILRGAFRSSDIIARLGGDEFVGLALETNEIGGEVIVSRLQCMMESYNLGHNRPYKISMSFGVSRSSPHHPIILDELFHLSDQAMYQHKQAKRD